MIILAGTPIGNLGDASPRLRAALESATVIAAEDTRTASHLLRALGITNRPRLIALHEHNETERAAQIVEAARDEDILIVTDAGMPAISDPGYVLVRAAIDAGVTVTAIPGPSAVTTALALSGLPTDRFTFEGFLPRKPGERRRALTALASEPRTMVFFESPHRLAASLTDIADTLGPDRRVAVARELTKLHEEVQRGTARELAAWAEAGVKGEVVIVVEGGTPASTDLGEGIAQVRRLTADGARLKDAAGQVAKATGLSQRDLYEGALAAKQAKAPE